MGTREELAAAWDAMDKVPCVLEKMLKLRADSSNHGRYCLIFACVASSSVTSAIMSAQRDCKRHKIACWMRKPPTTSATTPPAIRPTLRNLPVP